MYQFAVVTGPVLLERFTMASFAGFMVDVGYDANLCIFHAFPLCPSTKFPTTVDRSLDGGVIGFNFVGSNTVIPGDNTAALVIETNASDFNLLGALSAQDSSGTMAFGVGFQPTIPPVPEPCSLAMLGGGALVLGSSLRKFVLSK